MTGTRLARRGQALAWAAACVLPIISAGCGESVAHSVPIEVRQTVSAAETDVPPASVKVQTVSFKAGSEPAIVTADHTPAGMPTTEAILPAARIVPASAAVQTATKPATSAGEAVVTGDKAKAAAPAATGPRKVEVLIKDRTFTTDKESNALRVSYDDLDLLKVLNMEPVTLDAVSKMPEWLKQLNGKRVRIRGFMFPTFSETGISKFTLARDNQICCFGRSPKVYDLIEIKMKGGVTTDYIQNRPFDVVGTFRIEMGEMLDEGLISGLYFIDDAIVIEK